MAAALRHPTGLENPGLTPNRLPVYRELVRNNIQGFLDSCFPVARACLGEAGWQVLSAAFMADYACHSPYFRDIALQCVEWLQEGGAQGLDDPPPAYVAYLCHYEWLELRALTCEDPVQQFKLAPVGAQEGWVRIEPSAQWATYPFPVHQIQPGHDVPMSPTSLVVWRNAEGEAEFAEISLATAHLLDAIKQGECSVAELTATLSTTLGMDLSEALVLQELQVLEALGVVLGVVPVEPRA